MLGAALTTAPTPAATSSRALPASRSRCSTTAMSPGPSRTVSRSAVEPTRAVPWTPGSGASVRARRSVARRMAAMLPCDNCDWWDVAARPGAPSGASAGQLVLRRRREQLAGVRPGRLRVLQAGEHPRQLLQPAGPVQGDDAAAGDGAVVGLADHQVLVGEGGHLRQVGHDDDLGGPGQGRQATADL